MSKYDGGDAGSNTRTALVLSFERRRNTVSGNPQYRVHLDDGTVATTRADDMMVFTIPSYAQPGAYEAKVIGSQVVDLRVVA